MKSVSRKDFTEVGTLARIHGTKGELRLVLDQPCIIKEWAFPEYRGKPVPFFIQHCRETAQGQYLVKLEGIDSADQASEWVGRKFLVPKKQVKKSRLAETEEIIDFMVCTGNGQELGRVAGIQENQFQELLKVKGAGEILIPLVDAFIQKIDLRKKCIVVDLPDGFLDL